MNDPVTTVCGIVSRVYWNRLPLFYQQDGKLLNDQASTEKMPLEFESENTEAKHVSRNKKEGSGERETVFLLFVSQSQRRKCCIRVEF